MILAHARALTWPFVEKLDPARYGWHDYAEHGRRPMDLARVCQRLNSHRYAGVAPFAADVRAVFANARKYPGTEAGVRACAAELLRQFDLAFDVQHLPAPHADARGDPVWAPE